MSKSSFFDTALGVAGSRAIPILDKISTSSAAAYGLRKLRKAYAGSAIRVRRTSDNAELDIGFNNSGNLNTAALLAHCGASSGRVTTWYDQSGGGFNQTNTTAATQPSIVLSGVLSLFNGRPMLNFTAAGSEFLFNSGITGFQANNDFLISAVFEFLQAAQPWDMIAGWRISANTATASAPVLQGMSASAQIGMHNTDIADVRLKVDVTTRIAKRFATLGRTGGTNGNGGTVTVTTTTQPNYSGTGTQTWTSPTTIGFQIGGRQQVSTSFGSKSICEVICFASNLSTTDRQILENNQRYYFNLGT